MNLKAWYTNRMMNESGADSLIEIDELFEQIVSEVRYGQHEPMPLTHHQTPIGEDRRFDLETSLHWFGGPDDELRYPPPSEAFIRDAKIIDAHLRIRLVPSRP